MITESDSVGAGHAGTPRLPSVRTLVACRLLPATALLALIVVQLRALIPGLRALASHPELVLAAACLRALLYALFLSIPVAAFLIHEPPNARDERALVQFAAIVATFLLAGLGALVRSGPLLVHTSPIVDGIALVVTLAGAGLALAGAWSLGTNFSFAPEVRTLVARGPYRLVRHPIYLAELAMIAGVLVADLRLVPLVGTIVVASLQVVRIRAEERLLGSTCPGFGEFTSSTRYRLLPWLW